MLSSQYSLLVITLWLAAVSASLLGLSNMCILQWLLNPAGLDRAAARPLRSAVDIHPCLPPRAPHVCAVPRW